MKPVDQGTFGHSPAAKIVAEILSTSESRVRNAVCGTLAKAIPVFNQISELKRGDTVKTLALLYRNHALSELERKFKKLTDCTFDPSLVSRTKGLIVYYYRKAIKA